MLSLKTLAMMALVLGTAPVAEASSPDAWKELYDKASAACIKASALTGAKVRRETADFDATVLLIVDGRIANNARGTTYCLYDKISAKVQSAQGQITEILAKPKSAPKSSPGAGRTCWTESFRAQLKTPRPLGTICTAKNDEGDDYKGVVRP
jgi:ABC-type iron transport system FetAB permease component